MKLEGAAVVGSCKKDVEVVVLQMDERRDVYPSGGVVPAIRVDILTSE